ncbi:MAG TPA: ester cyclase [Herpetosiphonaceae bacterium]
MSAETKLALIQRLFDHVWNQGQTQLLDELLVAEQTSDSLQPAIQQIRANMRMLRAAFPDWQTTIEDTIVMPDRVLVRWTACGTQRGEFMGMAPTGTWLETSGISVYFISGERIREARVQRDSVEMIRQSWAELLRHTAMRPGRASCRAVRYCA